MKPMDLTGLIKGLMVVIGIAMALGRLDDLKTWAINEAFPKQIQPAQIHNEPRLKKHQRTTAHAT